MFAPTQDFQDLEKSARSRDPKTSKARGAPKELSNDISALCPLQDSREAYLRRAEPLIDPLLPKEQAGFRRGKSTVDQVVLLIQNIEDS